MLAPPEGAMELQTTPEPTDEPSQDHQEDPYRVWQTLLQRTEAVTEFSMRVPMAEHIITQTSPHTAAFVLDQLLRGGALGEPRAVAAILAMTSFFLQQEDSPSLYPRIRSIYEVAAEQERQHVRNYLLQPPPHRSAKNPRFLLQGPRFDRKVSLGERRQLAIGGNRKMLTKLLEDCNPMVVQRLCNNPRIQEHHIMTIATKRPNLPQTLHQIALTPRWLFRYKIRDALLRNPYSNTSMALKFLPLLRGTDLRQISQAGDLHPVLPQAAQCLLDLRQTQSLNP